MTLTELIKQGVVIGDGGLGSMLYESGVYINACYEELNLTRPDLIREIHSAYADAGCNFVETNTYGANRSKLAAHALCDKLEAINIRGVELARESAQGCLVAGSVGPILGSGAPEYIESVYAEQVSILDKAGVDFFIFETFPDADLLEAALNAAAKVTQKEIIALLRPSPNWKELGAEKVRRAVARIAANENAFAVGFNCGVGPHDMLDLLECTRELTDKHFCLMPNAGMPQAVDGRMFYMCTPEYVAEYSKRFYEKGVDIIGGCCGTNPKHIREIVRAVGGVNKADRRAAVVVNAIALDEEKNCKPAVALENRSELGRKLVSGEFIKSVEITPPRGINLDKVLEKARVCKDAGVDLINIPDGPRASFRQSAFATALMLKQAGIEPLMHVCARDRNMLALQADMLAAAAHGINDILFITGDPPKLGDYPDATGVFDLDAVGLARMASLLNCSKDITGAEVPEATAITIGVGANPVAGDMHRELDRFRMKVEAGAEYCITQPIFDVQKFYEFVESIKDCRIPIVAGIWPFKSFKNAEFMAREVPGVVVPEDLLARMRETATAEEATAEGIKIAREIAAEIRSEICGLAVSAPFGNVNIALSVLEGFD